jgi:hypothetical protein
VSPASDRVVLGMDPHKRSTTIEVMAAAETVLGGKRFGTDRDTGQVRKTDPITLAMLADALLAVVTAADRAETPSPQGILALTANQIRHLFTRVVTTPNTASGTCGTGHAGDAATKPGIATATTAVGRSNSSDHELRRSTSTKVQ